MFTSKTDISKLIVEFDDCFFAIKSVKSKNLDRNSKYIHCCLN